MRLAGPSRKFTEVVTEPPRTVRLMFWWDSQICQCGCQLYPDFGLYCCLHATWMRRRRSFICLRPVTLVTLVPPPCSPRWHNTGDDAGVPPHQTPMKEGEKELGRGTDAERRITMRLKYDCASKQNWGKKKKKLPLKLIIHPREEKPQPLPLPPPPPGLMVPTVSAPPVSTFTRCYRSQFCGSGSKSAVYLTDWQHTQKLY